VTPGITAASPLVGAAQMRPHQSPTGSFPLCPQSPPHHRSDTIHCELRLDKYTFHSHDTSWCPILNADNIREQEVKERLLQFLIQDKMKLNPIPVGLKKPKLTPLRACLPIANAHAAAVLPLPDTTFDELPLADLPGYIDAALLDTFP
jgi:hypothetical protein